MARRCALLTVPAAEELIGGSLSYPSKMPGPAWGISALECRRGSRLAEKAGTVCSSCYALRGRYLNPSVETAHRRRLAALADPRWPDAMAILIDAYARGGHFRWFDAGDLQSVDHLEKILWVAKKTPAVRHWLPTHEPYLVAKRASPIPGNLVVRISSDLIERLPRTPTSGLPTSTVHREPGQPVRAVTGRRGDSIECLAYLRGHHCGHCRACWSPGVQNVSYLLNAGLRTPTRAGARFHLPVLVGVP